MLNPNITKQAQEIVFSRKKNDTSHPFLYFNNARVQWQSVQKHSALFLDENVSFLENIDEKIKKATRG